MPNGDYASYVQSDLALGVFGPSTLHRHADVVEGPPNGNPGQKRHFRRFLLY